MELHAREQQLTEGKASLDGLKADADAATLVEKATSDAAVAVRRTTE
jgi:hypothetical protein